MQDELARKRWLKIPTHVREKLENNVFCINCGETIIVDYQVVFEDQQIVLRGKCKQCNGNVARVID
ncbi:hypothetical protein [Aquibacillus albus]|uniref:Formylmethanofuran dehydrogenase subunit E n=1 Tax=Aquibacillus albus TaxID=1168171 RepID=A0ABS2N637_9BACI|nr:hypothetical protein [Aquibacillus albus]MBM7573571.1 formylmethanofuran dehydrogenase subunit E [Aquibacillus albus]